MTKDFNVVIVGGGPAGLCAAITASSEGLRAAILDSKQGLGGQAKESSLIENYPGFPTGLTGQKLAGFFIEQASRFGAEIMCPTKAVALAADGLKRVVTTEDGDTLVADAVILASGLSYRRLDAKNIANFLGRGVSYGAPSGDFSREKRDYFIVGSANSAGQAAMHLATINPEARVRLLVRGNGLSANMSQYLIDKINSQVNIEVMTGTEVQEATGAVTLEGLVLVSGNTAREVHADALYIFIGAQPKTFWLNGIIARDERGFILTGNRVRATWELGRDPFPFETSMPAVFAAGDVRHGSTKRVVAAAGEGSVAVQMIHAYLHANQTK